MSITPGPGPFASTDEQPRRTAAPAQESLEEKAPSGAYASWFPAIVIVALLLVTAALIFVAHDASVTRSALQRQIAALQQQQEANRHRLEAADERQASLRDELAATRERLGLTERQVTITKKSAKELGAEQKQAAAQLGSQISSLRDESTGKFGAVEGEVSGVKSELSSTRKDLEATKTQLKSTIGDLGVQSGLIARNHDELLELKRRGERDYYEFDLVKEKNLRRVGSISLRLKKTDAKKGKYTLEVLADDKSVEKRDKTINEPVQFYVARARIPYEIVVNEVRKDRVLGYLATPK